MGNYLVLYCPQCGQKLETITRETMKHRQKLVAELRQEGMEGAIEVTCGKCGRKIDGTNINNYHSK